MICDEHVTNYIRKKLKARTGILRDIEIYAYDNNIPVIESEVAGLLVILGKAISPSKILEIGTAIGYSALLLSTVLEDSGYIDTIERDEMMITIAKKNIKMAGCDGKINVIAGDAGDVLSYIDKQYDMIFIDAAKGQYIDYLPHCIRLLRMGGLLIADNVLYRGMVAQNYEIPKRERTIVRNLNGFLDAICTDETLETTLIPAGDGLAISYKLV